MLRGGLPKEAQPEDRNSRKTQLRKLADEAAVLERQREELKRL